MDAMPINSIVSILTLPSFLPISIKQLEISSLSKGILSKLSFHKSTGAVIGFELAIFGVLDIIHIQSAYLTTTVCRG